MCIRDSLSADQSELNFTCNVDEETTAQIGVTGTNLKGSITASIDGADAAQFTVSPSTLTASGTMNVTYHPATSGNHTATLTISSTEADAVTITLNGTAKDTSVPTTYALTQDWAATTGHITPSGTGRGWSTGFNGKIYFNDDANSTLKYWDNSGLHTAVASVAGTAITSDEAGNIILSASLWSASATSFKVLPKGLSLIHI